MFMCEDEDTIKPAEFTETKMFYDFAVKTRTVTIIGEINQRLAERVLKQLLYLESISAEEPIKIIINSQGGHVEAGDTIHDIIKFIKPKVLMIGSGWVASAGVIIYCAADKKNRYCLPNTRFLIHQPSGGARGQASDIEIEAAEILKMKKRLINIISAATGQPADKIEREGDRNFWLDANAAMQYGLVNKIITSTTEIK